MTPGNFSQHCRRVPANFPNITDSVKRRQGSPLVLALFGLLILGPGIARAEALSIERMFAQPGLNGTVAQGVKMSPDGQRVSYLKTAADNPDAAILWAQPVQGGAPQQLLDTRDLGEAPKQLSDEMIKFLERRHLVSGDPIQYQWGADNRHILVSFHGDLFLLDTVTSELRRLTETDDFEADAKLASDSRTISFLRNNNLILLDLETGVESAVGTDVSEAVSYGTAEWVAQEEIQRFTGNWWSPTGRYLAYTRVDESEVAVLSRFLIGSELIEVVQEKYPLTGTQNAKVQLFIRPAAGGGAVSVDLGSDPDIYLFTAIWAKDGSRLYVQRQTRDQKRVDLLAVDPKTGKSKVLRTETSDTWVDLERDFVPLSDGTFIWGSATSGWRHLYLYDADGTLIRQITSGNWRIAYPNALAADDFVPVVGVDETHGLLYFLASIHTPVEQQLYSISYREPEQPRLITSGRGWWEAEMAGDRPEFYVGEYSDLDTPPQTALYDLSGSRVLWLEQNPLDGTHPYSAYLDHRPSYELGTIKAENGADLHYLMSKPADFDPARKYPVIIRVYGGPNVQIIRQQWQRPYNQILTQAGYVVFQLDNRGSANRDKAFEHALYGDLRGANTADQLSGIRFLKTLPFVDAERIGMMGWSFGAYMTVGLMTTPGSGIKAGAAGGTPADFRLYDTHYTERFLGTPQAEPEAYQDNALLPRLANLQGNLLLMQGLSDDNVTLQNFTSIISELQNQGKLFEMMAYPGQGHAVRGRLASTHVWKTYLDFFARRLAVKPSPGE
jgi:dipeptidyl-peptidase-4